MLRNAVVRNFLNAVFAGLLAGMVCAGTAPAADDTRLEGTNDTFPKYVKLAETQTTQAVKIGISKAIVIDLPRVAGDILVSDPSIADAILRTSRRAYIIGNKIGQANIFFFDNQGRQIANIDLYVQNDIGELERQLQRFIPGSDIQVEILNNNVVLTGTVNTPIESQRAADLASRFIGTKSDRVREQRNTFFFIDDDDSDNATNDYSQVLNLLTVNGSDQVMLKVVVAEMHREVIKQLGIDLSGRFGAATTLGSFPTHPVNKMFMSGNQIQSGGSDFYVNIRALEQAGLVKLLAEPTLTAVSGETAKFLAGGEIPFPVDITRDEGEMTIEMESKPIGVSLSFTPVVLSQGRINLKVNTEVSDVSTWEKHGLNGQTRYMNYTLPTIRVRRASTTVELPSGGSMAIAGLIEENVRQAMTGMPMFRKLPIIGALFRSRDYKRSETELAIIVTPYTVKPVARTELTDPTQGFVEASDNEAVFMGRLNRVYGRRQVQGRYAGNVGYVYK